MHKVPFLAVACALGIGAAAHAEALSPIRMNQTGFQPHAPKRAIVPNASAEPLPWRVVDADGREALRGTSRPFGEDASAGEAVHIVDFSDLAATGEGFRLIVGEAESRPFAISPHVLARLKYDALAYFYHNRAGTPIEARFAGGEIWARPAGHPKEVVTCFDGTDGLGNRWPGCDYSLDVTGGWYDAGDHGKYVVNGGIAVWTLLNVHERSRLKGRRSAFEDGQAAIPEAGNGVDDLLDEARWEMEFLLSMQVPDGKNATVPVGQKRPAPNLAFTTIDAGGMAHHKVADARWTALPMPPHLDPEPRLLYPPSTAATLNLAATAAQCARVWREIDPAFADRCLTAATRAYAAAERNPEVYAVGDFAGSGGYGDDKLSDEFFWAAAELYATTGDPRYAEAVRASPHRGGPIDEPSWPQVAALGTITLATIPSLAGSEDHHGARAAIVAAANRFLADSARTGYVIPYAPERYPWGSTSSLLNRALVLAYAHDFTGEARYAAAVQDALDYILGRNPLDQSYVSGYGARPMRNPHHRFWAHQLDPRLPPPPPGALSGGPNSITFNDPVAEPMRGRCAPQRCWADDVRAYSLNEVAINWNAPLVWVAAWADEGAR